MPPLNYSKKLKRFLTGTGKPVSRTAVREEINRLTRHVAAEAATLSKQLRAGQITLTQFEAQTGSLLKSGHIIAASIGKGGRANMGAADWGRVGAKIKWQYKYLAGFARRIARGTISEAMTSYRATLYASSIYASFSATFLDSMQQFVAGGKNPERCRLVTNSEEGCDECAADEAEGWVSVDDMGPIGSRICGDYCKCDIEFENDEIPEFQIVLDVTTEEES
jgi:hypothetical protein